MGSRKCDVVPPPTERDLEIVQAVERLGPMTRLQIGRLHFRRNGQPVSLQAVCRRLRLLSERGYLARTRLATVSGSGPYLYSLGPRAAAVIAGGEEASGRGRRRTQSLFALAHGLEIVDFYIALREGLEGEGGEITAWLGEVQARYAFTWQGRRQLLAPDGYCLWSLGEAEGAFFLEWDRGTESTARLTQKLSLYQAYYSAQAYREHLGETGLRPRLLLVTAEEARAERLSVWLGRRLSRGELASLPTVLIARRRRACDEILGAIWRRAGDGAWTRLVD